VFYRLNVRNVPLQQKDRDLFKIICEKLMKSISETLILLIFFALSFGACKKENHKEINTTFQLTETISLKSEEVKDFVITGFSFIDTLPHSDDTIFSYGVDIELPKINSNKPEAEKLNRQIVEFYTSKIELRKQNPLDDPNYFYKISYEHFLHDTILSLLTIEQDVWYLSEGFIKYNVFHYDLKNDKILTTNELLTSWGMSMLPVINAIDEKARIDGEPDFDDYWIKMVSANINNLKIYKNSKGEIIAIYQVKNNPEMQGEVNLSGE